MAEPRERRVAALVFLLCLLCHGYFFDREVGTNALAHYEQAVSIVAFHELEITRVLFLRPRDDTYTMDWSRVPDRAGNWHYYPAKSPGVSLASVPFEAALAAAERACGADPLEKPWFQANGRALSWILSSLPAALLAVLLLAWARSLGASLARATLGTLAVSIGSTWGPFASVLYAHVPTGVALALAAYAVLEGELTPRRAALAGAAGGVAVLLTYTAALALPAFAVVIWVRTRSVRALVAFAAGGLPALAVHFLYHAAAFGSPVHTAYDFQNDLYGGGGGASYVKTLEPVEALGRLSKLTFGPYRGLFFYSPVLLPALAAAVRDLKATRLVAGVALWNLGGLFAVTAMHHGWWGGHTTGPRYLVPAVPLLAPFAARAFALWPRATAACALVSLANALATAAVSVSVHENDANPLLDSIYPGLFHGALGRSNLGEWLGLAGTASLVPFVVVAGVLAVALARELRRDPLGRCSSF